MPPSSAACVRLFAAKGGDKIYSALLKELRARVDRKLVFEDLKSTCVHINAGEHGTAYAGAHPRAGSRNRCHCEVLLTSEADVDEELLGWLSDAAELVTQAPPRNLKTEKKPARTKIAK